MSSDFSFEAASALLVDCDGTLIDSLHAWDEIEEDIWKQTGPLSEEESVALHSAPIGHMAQMLHETYGIGASSDAVLQRFDAFMLDYYANRSVEMPGARDFLLAARKAKVPVVVVSSSPQRYLKAGFEHCGLIPLIDAIVSTEDNGISKQEPAIYLSALAKVNASLDGAWGVDDAPYAIKAMHAAGLNTIGVYEGADVQRTQELKNCATVYVPNLAQLLVHS